MSKKTTPAPVFNYRKRQRQAVFSDPETQPRSPLRNKKQQDLSIWCQNDSNVTAPLAHVSRIQAPNTTRALPSTYIPLLPAPRALASAARPTLSSSRPAFSGTRPTMSATRPLPAKYTLSSTTNTRPAFSSTRPTLSAARPALSATRPALPVTRPAPSATRPALSSARPALSVPRPTLSSARSATSAARPPQSATRSSYNIPHGSREDGSMADHSTEWSEGWPLQKSLPVVGLNCTEPHHTASSLPLYKEKAVERRRDTETASLRVLTLPIAHLMRVQLQLQTNALPPLLFTLYGILDSAIVSDRLTSGKSFVLRDETGSITCIFCEIDRQMPRLHRGQWYRVVCTLKSRRVAVQCLSLRPVNVEEYKAVNTAMATSTAVLNKIISEVMEQ